MSETTRFIHDTKYGICIGVGQSADPNNLSIAMSFVNQDSKDTYNRKIGRSIVKQRILSSDVKDTPYVVPVNKKRFSEDSLFGAWLDLHTVYHEMISGWDESVDLTADNIWETFENRLHTLTRVKEVVHS